jgi:hypothetical protein
MIMAANNDTLIDTVKVVLANITAITFGFIELERMRDDVESWLKIASLLVAMGYTIWKWRSDYKKTKK